MKTLKKRPHMIELIFLKIK
jgi:hypothetical protein